jgi:hypothetical protein
MSGAVARRALLAFRPSTSDDTGGIMATPTADPPRRRNEHPRQERAVPSGLRPCRADAVRHRHRGSAGTDDRHQQRRRRAGCRRHRPGRHGRARLDRRAGVHSGRWHQSKRGAVRRRDRSGHRPGDRWHGRRVRRRRRGGPGFPGTGTSPGLTVALMVLAGILLVVVTIGPPLVSWALARRGGRL